MLITLMRSIGARLVPTITRLPQTRVPTISAPVVVPPTNADHPQLVHSDRISKPSHAVDAATAATMFVRWAADHGLAREWSVDAVWFLASQDFAPAHDLALPPRRTFLGALQRRPGVSVAYDRRVRGRDGRVRRKTTYYDLARYTDLSTGACRPSLASAADVREKHAA